MLEPARLTSPRSGRKYIRRRRHRTRFGKLKSYLSRRGRLRKLGIIFGLCLAAVGLAALIALLTYYSRQ